MKGALLGIEVNGGAMAIEKVNRNSSTVSSKSLASPEVQRIKELEAELAAVKR